MNEGLLLGVVIIGVIILFIWLGASGAKKKRLEREARIKQELEEKAAFEKYKEEVERKRKERILKRYGDEIGYKILNEQYFIGMTKEQVLDAKGSRGADKKEKEELKTKVKETWIYGNKSSGDVFIFENEVLTKYKDR